jgi:hypothetical protein
LGWWGMQETKAMDVSLVFLLNRIEDLRDLWLGLLFDYNCWEYISKIQWKNPRTSFMKA